MGRACNTHGNDGKYEGSLKGLWTGGSTPLLCRGRR
jgi:hypothetical protein